MPLYRYSPNPDEFTFYFPMDYRQGEILRLVEAPDPTAFDAIELRTEDSEPTETDELGIEIREKKVTDFPVLSMCTPLLSDRALDVLGPMLDGQVVVHRVRVYGPSLVWLNALRVLTIVRGAVDLTKSDCTINPFSKSVSVIRALAVDESLIPPAHLFKLYETRYQHTYISDALIAEARSGGLIGFGYSKVTLIT